MKPTAQQIRNELAAIVADLARKMASSDDNLVNEAHNIQAIGAALSSLGKRIEQG